MTRFLPALLLSACSLYRAELLDEPVPAGHRESAVCHPEESARQWAQTDQGDLGCDWDLVSSSYVCNNGGTQLTIYWIDSGFVSARRYVLGQLTYELLCGCGACKVELGSSEPDGGQYGSPGFQRLDERRRMALNAHHSASMCPVSVSESFSSMYPRSNSSLKTGSSATWYPSTCSAFVPFARQASTSLCSRGSGFEGME